MIPGWKVRRELARLGQQLRAIPEAVSDPIRQRYHDRMVFPRLEFTEGQRRLGPKIAILLLYQPRGIAESTIYTCGFLASKGYSALVVSNAPVSEADRQRLAPEAWRIVERPNFGYDFGGYRDGIRLLWRWGLTPETLVMMNDSVWFPLDPETLIIEDLEAHPAGLAGSILRVRGQETFLESYLYRIRADVFLLADFRSYWENLRLTSNKYNVIRRGERGFSHAIQSAGYAIAGLYPDADLPRYLKDQDNVFLRDMLRHAAYIDGGLSEERDRLVASNEPEWRDQVLDHVERTLVKRQAYSSFPVAMVRLFGYPILKKSREPASRSWLRAWRSAVDAGDLQAAPAQVTNEVERSLEEVRC